MLWFLKKKKVLKKEPYLFSEVSFVYPEIYKAYGILPAIDSFLLTADIPSDLITKYRANYFYAISRITAKNLLGTTRIDSEVIACIFGSERRTADRKSWELFLETKFTHNVIFGYYLFDGSWQPLLEFSANFSVPGMKIDGVVTQIGKEFCEHVFYPDFKIIKPHYFLEESPQSQMFWLNLHQMRWRAIYLKGKL